MAEFRDLSGMGENILNSYYQGRERRREDDARMFYGQAAQGNQDALKSLFGVAPQQALQLQSQQKAQSKADQEEIATLVWKGASAIKAAPPQVKSQVYAMVREQLAKHSGAQEWLAHLPTQYDQASAAAIDPVIEGIIAKTGMYQGTTNPSEQPAQLRVFEGLMQAAGYRPGTPEYIQAARIYANMDPKARAQLVQDTAGGYQSVEFGGGNGPVASPVMTGAPKVAPQPEIVTTGGGQPVMGTGQQLVNDDGSLVPNPDFDALNPVERSKLASYARAGVPFHVLNGKVIAGNTSAARQQLMGPTKSDRVSVPSGYRAKPDGSLEPIPGGPADKNNATNIDAKGEMQLRKEYADLVKEPLSIINSYKKVQSAGSSPTAAGDLSMIFAYMKMLDPNSVVREQEFANAQNAAGVPDQIANLYNKVLSGQRLNPIQRADFLTQAKKLADQAQQSVSGYKKRYGGLAKEYGFSENRITFDPNTIEDAEMTTPRLDGSSEPKRTRIKL